MKKAKVLVATVLASSLVLSGCTFEEGLEMAKSWANDNVAQPVVNFWNEKILGKKPQEPEKEKEEKEEEGEKPAPVAQLLSISVSGQFKSEYEVGEAFDSTGIVVTAAYDDQSTQDVSSQASFSGFDSSAVGPCTVTVSFGGQSATIDLTIVPAVKRAWTSEEEAVFSDHLHGVVLPFLPVEGATPVYDASSETVRIFDPNGEALQVSGNDIPDYAALFVAADGWEDVSNQYSAFSSAPAGSFWVFERSVQTQEGTRRLSIQFFGASGSSYSLSGSFYLYASDPFCYEFPAAAIAQAFADLQLTPFAIPAPEGDGLWFEFNPDPDNAYYLAQGYTSYVYDHLYIYGLTAAGYSAYLEKFEAAGWEFTSNSGTYSGTKLTDDGVAKILTADAGDYAIVRIYYVMDPLPSTEWPTDEVAALVQAAVPGSNTVIPPFTSSDITNISVDTYYNEIDIDGPESLKAEYADVLAQALWTAGSVADTYISPAGDVQVKLTYSTYYEQLWIQVSAIPEWPAADVADLVQTLVPGSNTVIPACEGGTKYSWWTSTELDVYGSASALATNYAAALEGAGWTSIGTNIYLSPAEDITVEIAVKSSWIEIYFGKYVAPAPVWPADEVAALLPAGTTDSLPAFEGENTGFNVLNDEYGTAVKVSVAADTEADAIAAYQATLQTAGYTELIPDSSGDMQYLSPNNQLLVCVYMGTSGSITIAFGKAPILTWAGLGLADYIAPSTDPVPEIEGAAYYSVNQSTTTYVVVRGYFASSDAAATALASYKEAIEAAGWEFLGNDSYGDPNYSSPNDQYTINVYKSGNAVVVALTLPAPTVWPSSEVASLLASFGFTDPIPALEGGAGYQTTSYYGYPQIYISYNSAAEASAAQTAYQALLEQAGFTDAGDYYGDPKYASPNGQFEISPWVSSTTLVIDINTTLD